MRLKLALATLEMRPYAGLAAFKSHMEELAVTAAEAGCHLLLLPELTCAGLLWTNPDAASTTTTGIARLYDETLTPLHDSYVGALSALAVCNRIAIAGATLWHREKDRRLNSGFVLYPDGRISRQDKIHPTRPERAIRTVGGEGLCLFDIAGVTAGMAICYDLQFPEITRRLVDAGAEVILTPSLTDARGYWRVRHCAHARAIENQCFVCVSPLVGDLGLPLDRPTRGHGEAYVACPIDNRFAIADGTYARAEQNRESLLITELDFELLRQARLKAEIRPLADRRPDLYAALTPSFTSSRREHAHDVE